MRLPRSSGILLHPTSLPGRHGIGDLGGEARRFVDQLVAARLGLWQVLPLGPTGYGDSPYQCFSAFAGNPLLIAPDNLAADGLLDELDLVPPPGLAADRVAFGPVIAYKRRLLDRVAERFRIAPPPGLEEAFAAFRREQTAWLDDYALFMALKDEHGGTVWTTWEADLVARAPATLARWRRRLAERVAAHQLFQFLFSRQWTALRAYARSRAVRIVGDMPIFVAHDSADVWAHPELFHLDAAGNPTVVAGVPPDYFSATGQLWGNPLYRWDVMARRRYGWWIARIRAAFALFDVLRIDHFIGFTRYWEIPAGAPTAVGGRWVEAPGVHFARAVGRALGPLPIVAEDLGALTPDVEALRDRLELPGMRVLQFAFGGDPTNRFLPHTYPASAVVYTGTHDNDTTLGWFATATAEERSFVQRYLARSGDDIAYDLIRAAFASVADTAIVPLQDVLGLGSEARMNLPGRAAGNWAWRMQADALGEWQLARLRTMVEIYDRASAPPA